MQRVLIAALDGSLYRRIMPESLHCGKALLWKGIIGADVFSRCYYSLMFLLESALEPGGSSMGLMHMRLWYFIVHSDFPHLFRNDLEGDNHIGEDNLADFFSLIQVKALRVNDAHLLQDGRFS